MSDKYTWITPMRDADHLPAPEGSGLRGQVALRRRPDGGAYVIVMPARGTFPADAVISADDVRALITALAPQPERATAFDFDLPLWLHVTCGGTFASHSAPKLTVCRKCDYLTGESDWRALYVLPDGA